MRTAMLSGTTQSVHTVSLGLPQFGQLSNGLLADHCDLLGDLIIVDRLSLDGTRGTESGALGLQRP